MIDMYQVISANYLSEIDRFVNEEISHGWVPCGGISVQIGGGMAAPGVFFQAMIKMKSDEEK